MTAMATGDYQCIKYEALLCLPQFVIAPFLTGVSKKWILGSIGEILISSTPLQESLLNTFLGVSGPLHGVLVKRVAGGAEGLGNGLRWAFRCP